MLIRCQGYNAGVKEYLEEGIKNGRELSRDELDERIILDGNLELTDKIYKSIPDEGQDRYLTFTLSFKEDEISTENLEKITQEFKQFMMAAYHDDEFNFYAEAHIPKIKTMQDKKTGDVIERKPHIHVVIPRKNLLSGNEMNPVGSYKQNEKYFEAFQEYINQKYHLASPRDNVRATPVNYSDMLSRYKGDDFRAKNRDFKKDLLEQVLKVDIKTRKDFYDLVSQYGETKIRNEGKDNEYIAVKLEGDKRFTNLKEGVFNDDFIINRSLSKPPLDKSLIQRRLAEWGRRSAEIKYIDKISSPKLRKKYYAADSPDKHEILTQCINKFYNNYRGHNELRSERTGNYERGLTQVKRRRPATPANRVQDLSDGNVAGSRERKGNKMLLPGDARLHMANDKTNGDIRLRRSLRTGGRGRTRGTATNRERAVSGYVDQRGYSRHSKIRLNDYPHYPRIKNVIPTLEDIQKRSRRLFPTTESYVNDSPLKIVPPKNKSQIITRSSLSVSLLHNINNSISQGGNKSLKEVDDYFYRIRREVMTDKRFNQEEKAQLLSVINFERLKRRNNIMNGVPSMGSQDIRKMVSKGVLAGYTISAPEEEKDTKSRFERTTEKLRNPVNYSKIADEDRKKVESKLTAANLYTKHARNGNVHYRNKDTHKTLFVDNGQKISMKKNGLSKDSVAIALELAQGRFGSTLNIKGSQKFKDMVIEVAAERGLDIHFTSKAMNKALAERRAALAQQKERGQGFSIEKGEPVSPRKDADVSEAPQNRQEGNTKDNHDEPFYRSVKQFEGHVVKHGAAPYLGKEGNKESYYVTLKDKNGVESTHWGVGLRDAMKGIRRGNNISLELKESRPVQVRTRDADGKESVKDAVRNVWDVTRMDSAKVKTKASGVKKSPSGVDRTPDMN